MNEQPGQAAGTAEPIKPILWSAQDNHSLPALVEVFDESGALVGLVHRTHCERLLACVNFCANYSTEILASVDGDKLRVVIERTPQYALDAIEEFRRNSAQFHEYQANRPGGLM